TSSFIEYKIWALGFVFLLLRFGAVVCGDFGIEILVFVVNFRLRRLWSIRFWALDFVV
ncbi:6695_t:CDS:1, partial [Gigaspora rosea]